MSDWLDEIDFDPGAPWLRMGTRSLGHRTWLVIDDHYEAERSLKVDLVKARHDEVFAALPGSEPAGEELLAMVIADLDTQLEHRPPAEVGVHPLDAAGRLVQEDLCLLNRRLGGWYLDAASLCFPSRWRLADKIGRRLDDVHRPVVGYTPTLADRVEGLLDDLVDRVDDRPVLRRNWFIHPDGALFQPERPSDDPVRRGSAALEALWLRSERQTLRCLPRSGWVVFTIRIQQATLGEVVADPGRRTSLGRYLVDVDAASLLHRGVSAEQAAALRAVLLDRGEV